MRVPDMTPIPPYPPVLTGEDATGLSLLEQLALPSWTSGASGGSRFANTALAAYCGCPATELEGTGWFDRIHPQDVASVRQTVDAAQAAGRGCRLHYRLRGADGAWHRVLEIVTPRFDAQQVLAGYVGMVIDLSDAPAISPAPDTRADLLTQVVEHSVHGVVICDAQQPDSPITYINPAFTRMTGYEPEEILGRNGRFLQGAEPDQAELQRVRVALRDGQAVHALLRNYRKDGQAFWNEFHLTPVRQGEDGKITHYIGVMQDVTAQKKAEEQLAFQTNYDPLTRLPNRQLLIDRLSQAIARAKRDRNICGLMLLGLDRFKYVNDTLGHEAGDALLQQTTQRLCDEVRGADTVAHPGGDMFALVLADFTDEEDLAPLAGKLLACFDAPFQIGGQELFISASLGIATCPRDGQDAATLMKSAEAALYRAKDEGRSRFTFFRTELLTRAQERLTLEAQLRRAVQRKEFELYFQPQADLRTGELLGAEALIRWRHPELGLVPPSRFIPVAEDSLLIVAIGEWVLDEACRQAAQWRDAGLPAVTVAVNLSARQFRDPSLLDVISEVYTRHRLTAGMLELELTESMVVEHPERAIQVMRHLAELGVQLSLDDFGTGYSSLSYLKRFPLNKIKIDRSFVRDLVSDPDSAAIARAIVSLAHDMRMRVIAEGVETEAQALQLRRKGCDELQGFWYSPPLTADAFTGLLAAPHVLPWQTPPDDAPERTLLLVDDEPAILTSLTRSLRQEGYTLLTASSGEEALELLARQPVGVILSDQRMPGMPGVELLRRARQMYPDVVRMILSGYADVLQIAQAINDGAIFKFVSKPWDDTVLKMHLKEAFELSALRSADRI